MAKQPEYLYTVDMLDKPKRGRPRKPNAMTDAQRAREYRARKRALTKEHVWHFPYTKEWCEQHGVPYCNPRP